MRIARFSQGSSIYYGALEDESTRIVGLSWTKYDFSRLSFLVPRLLA